MDTEHVKPDEFSSFTFNDVASSRYLVALLCFYFKHADRKPKEE